MLGQLFVATLAIFGQRAVEDHVFVCRCAQGVDSTLHWDREEVHPCMPLKSRWISQWQHALQQWCKEDIHRAIKFHGDHITSPHYPQGKGLSRRSWGCWKRQGRVVQTRTLPSYSFTTHQSLSRISAQHNYWWVKCREQSFLSRLTSRFTGSGR